MSGNDLLDSAVTDAIAADAVVSGNQRRRSAFPPAGDSSHCSNCQTALKGPVCHSCGQEADTFHRPVWSLVLEVLDGLFSFDGRFWRTLPALIFRPGHVTRHYLTGVRARYVQPFRLFIVASLVFFLVFSLDSNDFTRGFMDGAGSGSEELAEADRALAEAQVDNPEAAAAIGQVRAQLNQVEADQDAAENGEDVEDSRTREQRRQEGRDAMELSMRQSLLPEDYPDAEPTEGMDVSGLDGLPYPVRVYLAERIGHVIQEPESWRRSVAEWTPRIIFALVPIYALLLALMHFWRRGIFYYDHLVVSLHFHSFLFLLMTTLVLLSPLIGAGGILVFFVWSNFYLYKLHRKIYGHGRFFALMRVVVIDILYFVVLLFAMLILFAMGVLLA
ncbi:MAG: hypothetical protein CMF74_08575 [Maricaulis sp.]|nr:hypothetical protein [Maricaulis sp.]